MSENVYILLKPQYSVKYRALDARTCLLNSMEQINCVVACRENSKRYVSVKWILHCLTHYENIKIFNSVVVGLVWCWAE